MKKGLLLRMTILLTSLFIDGAAFAWNQDVTHKDLSGYAAEYSVLGDARGNYLKNLGFQSGLSESLLWEKAQTVREWLRDGARLEDKSIRSYNHFHNPLMPWSQAGLNDWTSGMSSILWGQAEEQSFTSSEGLVYVFDNWSWQKTRDYFYQALTSPTATARQEYFAMTFRGLGHQMHLLQDAAVPDHTRNDAHAEDSLLGKSWQNGSYYFETYIKEQRTLVQYLAANPKMPTVSLNVSYDGLAPITQLIDTMQYRYGLTPSDSLAQGLSEYTNANFFSNGTLFAAERYSPDDKHYFPYPNKLSTNVQDFVDV